jgi:hypothetical protein
VRSLSDEIELTDEQGKSLGIFTAVYTNGEILLFRAPDPFIPDPNEKPSGERFYTHAEVMAHLRRLSGD